MLFVTNIIIAIVAFAAGYIAAWYLRQYFSQKTVVQANKQADTIIAEAKAESESLKKEMLLEANDTIFQQRQALEQETKQKSGELEKKEQELANRELSLDNKFESLKQARVEAEEREKSFRRRTEQFQKREEELERLIREENERLERISGLSTEQAKEIQMKNMLEQARNEAAELLRGIREETKRTSIRECREIMLQSMQRASISHVVDSTISILTLPDDEMKGRIIGREGRNIRAFENATGIEVLIDDTPKTVVLSGFNPIRREVARLSMEKLIYDGRIHPGRIEEVVEKSREEIEEKLIELGEQALTEVGVHNMHSELVRLLGRQHFRTNYGQNLLQHSKEVATLTGEMASVLGLESNLARRAGLLHDVGKTAQEYGNSPAHEIAFDLAKKFGEHEIVQNAIACQAPFQDTEVISPIAILVQIADSISVSRPGARKEMLETYLKRMEQLEKIAIAHSGVSNCFALQAGRELRVMVEHSLIDDDKAQSLADTLVQQIQREVEYPGQVRVTVIREFRAIDYAK